MNANLAARLTERAAQHPERIAIVDARGRRVRRVSFGDLERGASALAARMRQRGLDRSDAILLFVPMSIELYVALLAVFHLGATAVFVDAWADPRRLDAAVDATKPRGFIGTPKAHLLRLFNRRVRRIPVALFSSRWHPAAPGKSVEGRSPPAELAPDAPALVTFTTGSTGRPKAAARSHGFLWAQHLVLADHLGLTDHDVDMPTLPVFVLNNLASGTCSVLPAFDPRRPADFDAERVFRQMAEERVTTTSGSPAFYQRLLAWCVERRTVLGVRALFTGGAPVLPPLARLLASDVVSGTAHVVYGSTEAEPIASIPARDMVSMLDGEGSAESPRGLCAGHPVAQIALRLIRPHDGPVELSSGGWPEWDVGPGDVGEIVVSGKHVLAGYFKDPDADRSHKIRDDGIVWHRTGDGAWRDDDGRVWLMGRVSQRITRDGHTWWNLPAELRAMTLRGVRHAAYLGVSGADHEQRALLCLEMADQHVAAHLLESVRAALNPYPVDELRLVSQIPRDPRHHSKTDVGKLRALLRARGVRGA